MRKISRRALGITVAAATGVIAVGAWTTAAHAGPVDAATSSAPQASTSYRFTTLNNAKDETFNQLLGISNAGTIAGYFGSGAAGHPNKGYLLFPPFGQRNYVNENFPGSEQTQLTGLNDNGTKVGFYSTMNTANQMNNNFGFWQRNGKYHVADFPTGSASNPPVDQLLGVNNNNIAVGFWTDTAGNTHGYEYDINTNRYYTVTDPSAPSDSLTAAAINNHGDIAGFYTNGSGVTEGFLKEGGKFITLSAPDASATTALGVNDHNEVVGTYTVGTGSSAVMHGFTWTQGGGFKTVNDPHGVDTTTINGVNNAGDLVGFYVDSAGNTDGMLAVPQH